MRAQPLLAAVSLLAAWSAVGPAAAVETKVTVRVLAHDAKFVGSAVGGAAVTITDTATGRVLANGLIRGSTGDTKLIMKTPRQRHMKLVNEQAAAGWTATLDIDRPTRVRITVRGPLAAGANAAELSRTLWLLPGRDLTGNGVVFDMPGMIVRVVTPQPHTFVPAGVPLTIEANLTMMCGCPVTPGGLWDAGTMQVVAHVYDATGREVEALKMEYAGQMNRFRTRFTPQPGSYRLVITAAQEGTINAGVAFSGFVARAPKPKQ